MKTKQELAGIYVASITAYDQAGNVDAAALQKLMQRNINEGAAGFFVGGSSGECFMLTEAERVQVFEASATPRPLWAWATTWLPPPPRSTTASLPKRSAATTTILLKLPEARC